MKDIGSFEHFEFCVFLLFRFFNQSTDCYKMWYARHAISGTPHSYFPVTCNQLYKQVRRADFSHGTYSTWFRTPTSILKSAQQCKVNIFVYCTITMWWPRKNCVYTYDLTLTRNNDWGWVYYLQAWRQNINLPAQEHGARGGALRYKL